MLTFNRIGHYGRLGNQMFQYASLLGIAKNRGFDYGIRYANKDEFAYANPLVGKEKLDLVDAFGDLSAKDSTDVTPDYALQEEKHEFDTRIYNDVPDKCDLTGYFQTEKYFASFKDEVKKDFTFKEEIVDDCKRILSEIDTDRPLVSVHIRRGDYTQLQDFHPLCPVEYYLDSLNIVGNDHYPVVFSDDIEWCKNNLKLDEAYYCDGNDQFVDMCLMSMCDSNIIANSSFSWWGAWLNRNENKTVVAPSQWFGSKLADKNTDDMYCEGWVKCPTTVKS
jgi:hypothetical protein